MNTITFDLEETYTGGKKRVNFSNGKTNSHPYWIDIPDGDVDQVTLTNAENLIVVYLKRFVGEIEANGTIPNGSTKIKKYQVICSKEMPVPPEMEKESGDDILAKVREVLEKSLD